MSSNRRFGPSYREEARLSDGRRIVLRLLGPADVGLLQRHFSHLSFEGRQA
jgi:hypothetical protein